MAAEKKDAWRLKFVNRKDLTETQARLDNIVYWAAMYGDRNLVLLFL